MAEDGILAAPAPIRVYENTYQMQPLEFQRFHRSAAEKLLKEVLEDKMAFTNERDKKGRLAFQYNSDDAAETIREIVEECQKKVVGMPRRHCSFFPLPAYGGVLPACAATAPGLTRMPRGPDASFAPCLAPLPSFDDAAERGRRARQGQLPGAALQVHLPGDDGREPQPDDPQCVALPVGLGD